MLINNGNEMKYYMLFIISFLYRVLELEITRIALKK